MRGQWRRAEDERAAGADREAQHLALAGEIDAEVQRTAGDPDADLDDLARALDEWPADLRAAAVVDPFRQLPAAQRWDILAGLFDDDDLRVALVAEHERATADAARAQRVAGLLAGVGETGVLDTSDVPRGGELTVGLFRAMDVRTALPVGPSSALCARRLALRATDDDGRLVVVDDVFNPGRGLFVTPEYDEAVWRDERLDIESAGVVRRGRLHAGYATIDCVNGRILEIPHRSFLHSSVS